MHRKLPPEDQIRFAVRFLRQEAGKPAPQKARKARTGPLARLLDAVDDITTPIVAHRRQATLRAIARFLEDLLPKQRRAQLQDRFPHWLEEIAAYKRGEMGNRRLATILATEVAVEDRHNVRRSFDRWRAKLRRR